MRKFLLIGGLTLGLATLVVWLATGASRGWTKTSVPVGKVDEVTGIEGIEYKKRFVAGVDFLAAGLLGAGVLTAVALLFPGKSIRSSGPNTRVVI